MAQQTINIGSAPDDGTGDTLRVGGDKINDNFTELYTFDVAVPELIRDTMGAALVAGTNITITPNDGSDTITIAAASGGSIEVLDEGVTETSALVSLDFVGAGVTAADDGFGNVTVTIAGGGGYNSENARDDIAAALVAGTGITITPDDGADTITIAASASGALSLISEQSPSGTGVVTFSSIPSTYRDLVLVIRGRGTTAATSVAVLLTFNNDTGANYDKERLTANNNSTVSGAGVVASTSIDMGAIVAASATADVADAMMVEIFDYRGTTFQKAVSSRNTTKVGTANTNLTVNVLSGWWRSTAAINRVDVTLNAGNFVSGSVVSLYGRM